MKEIQAMGTTIGPTPEELERINRAAHILVGAEDKVGISPPEPDDVEAIGMHVAMLESAVMGRTPLYSSYKDTDLFDAVVAMHRHHLNSMEFLDRFGETSKVLSMVEAYLTALLGTDQLDHLETVGVGASLEQLNEIHARMQDRPCCTEDTCQSVKSRPRSWWSKFTSWFRRN